MVIDGFVLDASVTAAWCFRDEASQCTDALLGAMERRQAVVPGLWHFETASLLLRAERRGRITGHVCVIFVELLGRLRIETDTESERRALGPVLTLARAHNLTPYDAAYLEVAIRRRLSLATRDRDLERAAQQVGVALIDT